MSAMWVVAKLSLRQIARRRGVVLLIIALPLSFYLIRRDLPGESIRFLALGLGWAVSTLALFASTAARDVDRRLSVTGLRPWQLLGGRVLAMLLCGLVLAGADGLLVWFDQDVGRQWAVVLLLVTTVCVAAPLGTLVAALVPRELEGALALLTVMAMQMLADPAGTTAKFLPFWSTRELGTYAIDGTASEYLIRGLTHFGVTWLLLAGGSAVTTAVRLRLVRLPAPS